MKKAWLPLALATLVILAFGGLSPWPSPAGSQATATEPTVDPDLPIGDAAPAELPDELAPEEPVLLADGCTAETTCSSGYTISCSAGPGAICGSNAGWDVFCGTCTVSCSTANERAQCEANCDAAYQACASRCITFFPCVADCAQARFLCRNSCAARYPLTCTG